MNYNEKELSIESINDLMRCLNLASLLELSGWPKPGNVHRTKDFKATRFEHFLAGIAAIQPNFKEFISKTYKYSMNIGEDYSFVKLGYFFRESVKEMIKWQKGGNVLLGHILILAPLAAAAAICLKSREITFRNFVFNIQKVIKDSTVNDTLDLYEAISTCKPGGLGIVEKYDVNDKNSLKDIKSDKITLRDIFELSKDHDLISLEYSTGMSIILNEGLPYFLKEFEKTKDINIATVHSFLNILSEHPDTLIIRKSGLNVAKAVSEKAREILKSGGLTSKKGKRLIEELDDELQGKEGQMNPGTTADLVGGVIFCALLFGLKF